MNIVQDLTEEEVLSQAILYSRPDTQPYYYQYAILRTDIEMDIGKMLTQCGHAYTDSLRSAEFHNPSVASKYRTWCNQYNDSFNGGAKVAMKAKNSNQIIKAYNLARKAGIPCAIIVDKGHIYPPHFKGQPIITGLGIGPCTQEEARDITKRFTCF